MEAGVERLIGSTVYLDAVPELLQASATMVYRLREDAVPEVFPQRAMERLLLHASPHLPDEFSIPEAAEIIRATVGRPTLHMGQFEKGVLFGEMLSCVGDRPARSKDGRGHRARVFRLDVPGDLKPHGNLRRAA